jgi:hypothetical protein
VGHGPRKAKRALFHSWRGAKSLREIVHRDHDDIAEDAEYLRSIAQFLQAPR